MYEPGWLFITQLLCLAAPLIFVIVVRPFEDWLKNISSAAVYCTSILAIIAPICPKDAQVPLGYLIVILMCLFCVAMVVVTFTRMVRDRLHPTLSKHKYYHSHYCNVLCVLDYLVPIKLLRMNSTYKSA